MHNNFKNQQIDQVDLQNIDGDQDVIEKDGKEEKYVAEHLAECENQMNATKDHIIQYQNNYVSSQPKI
jgi:hypothetical protein